MKRIFTILLLTVMQVFATSYVQPERRKIFSFNKKYYIITDPHFYIHKIYKADNPDKEIWSFKCGMWHFPVIVSNDGSTVAIVSWCHMQNKNGVSETPIEQNNAIRFYKSNNQKIKIKMNEVFPNPPKTKDITIGGPVGDFWRTWYSFHAIHDDFLSIKLTNGKTATFDLTTCKKVKPAKGIFPVKKEHRVWEKKLPAIDSDKDGCPDYLEMILKLDPNKDQGPDADGDGFENKMEHMRDYSPADPKDHPDILYLCYVTKWEQDILTLHNPLTKVDITLAVKQKFKLFDRSGQSENYKVTEINLKKKEAKIASYVSSEILTIKDKPKEKVIPLKK